MPSPVDALPCGSRSTISTRSPIAASAVPRLIAVVVLPTPPFWLASASTRGILASFVMAQPPPIRSALWHDWAPLRTLHHHHAPALIGPAGNQRGLDIPISRSLGQFGLYILALEKQGLCT